MLWKNCHGFPDVSRWVMGTDAQTKTIVNKVEFAVKNVSLHVCRSACVSSAAFICFQSPLGTYGSWVCPSPSDTPWAIGHQEAFLLVPLRPCIWTLKLHWNMMLRTHTHTQIYILYIYIYITYKIQISAHSMHNRGAWLPQNTPRLKALKKQKMSTSLGSLEGTFFPRPLLSSNIFLTIFMSDPSCIYIVISLTFLHATHTHI